MKKQLFFSSFNIVFVLTLLITASCNDDSAKKNSVENSEASTATNMVSTAPQPAAAAFNGTLDTLWTDSLSFTKMDKDKAVFAFYAGGGDTLTLHGWKAKGILQTEYNPVPDISLLKGKAGTLSYGSGSYFGNVIVKDVKGINKLLDKEHAKYVLFAPQKTDGHIWYKIFLSNDDPIALVKMFNLIATSYEANPSPPKTY